MMNNPLVCICVPTYNAENTVAETLASILTQTYINIVVHVVDNASTDKTLEVVASFDDVRLSIYAHDENIGGEGNFTRCIQLAEGEYTAIFHADDVYQKDIIEKQVAVFEGNKKVGAVFTSALVIDAHGLIKGRIGSSEKNIKGFGCYTFIDFFPEVLKRGNFVVCPSALVKTSIYKEDVGNWRGEIFGSSSDLDVWLRISQNHMIVFINETLLKYRVDKSQFSHSIRMRIDRADLFLVLDHYLSLGSVKRILKKNDARNYQFLLNNDLLWRAINCFLLRDDLKVKSLLGTMKWKNPILWFFKRPRDAMSLLITGALHLMIMLRMQMIGGLLVRLMRGILNK